MIKHLMAAAALAGCGMVASAAYAGSPYYADPGAATTRPTASHALGTSHTGGAWANSGYTATATDGTFGTQAAPTAPAIAAPATVAAPQDGTVQAVPQYFYHAEGSMGAH